MKEVSKEEALKSFSYVMRFIKVVGKDNYLKHLTTDLANENMLVMCDYIDQLEAAVKEAQGAVKKASITVGEAMEDLLPGESSC